MVTEAKNLVIDGILRDLPQAVASGLLDPASPDPTDPGKFVLGGKPARVIHHFSGWHVKINLDWFRGSFDMPRINRLPFHWYAFAIPGFHRCRSPHYLICDYLQVREWVLEFAAPKGIDHRDHDDWMANIHVDAGLSGETEAYFRWGDERLGDWSRTSRIVRLDNAATVVEHAAWQAQGKFVGTTAAGGESEAHRRLKLYVARTPELLHMRPDAVSELEHLFCTGDRVDLLFGNHRPLRAVVERTMPLDTPQVRAFVISHEEPTAGVSQLARGYDVGVLSVDRDTVLAPTA